MRYTSSVNNVKCLEWGINLQQGALVDLINQVGSWADTVIVDNEVYYWVSRTKVVSEIPLAYQKTDTAYRALKLLHEKGIIEYRKHGKKDLVRMTKKGKTWNVKGTVLGDRNLGNKSELPKNPEINPSKSGNKSEKHSEINPTYKSINTNKNTNDKTVKKNQKVSVPQNFQNDGFHPSHIIDLSDNSKPENSNIPDNWQCKAPLPNLTFEATYEIISKNLRKNESKRDCYNRLHHEFVRGY